MFLRHLHNIFNCLNLYTFIQWIFNKTCQLYRLFSEVYGEIICYMQRFS